MSRWRDTSIRNLLEHSTEKTDHTIAAKEWEFTGKVIDHYVSDKICQLCEGENLRYHFEITNNICNNRSLLVGSSCIQKFNIAVFDESGVEIFGNQKSSFLRKKIEEKKQELMLEQIRTLWKKSTPEEKDLLEYYVNSFKRKNGFRPDDLRDLLSLMEKHGIEYTPVLFKVALRSQFELSSLVNMSDQGRKSIFPCLSVAQKKRFTEKKQSVEKENEEKEKLARKKLESTDCKFETSQTYFKKTHSFSNSENYPLKYSRPSHNPANHKPPPKPEKKNYDPVVLPEYVTCSICSAHTNKWVTLNPNKCRKCLDKLHLNK